MPGWDHERSARTDCAPDFPRKPWSPTRTSRPRTPTTWRASATAGAPAVVVLPRTVEQVQHVMRTATALRVPVVPQGARTGLSGGGQRLRRLHRAVPGRRWTGSWRSTRSTGSPSSNPASSTPTLSRAVDEHGLYYPPDPSSWEMCTIGGNIGTGVRRAVLREVRGDRRVRARPGRGARRRPAAVHRPPHRQGRRRATT